MEEINFNHREYLVVIEPLKPDFNHAKKRVLDKFPLFKVAQPDFENHRLRYLNGEDHYEFYLEKK